MFGGYSLISEHDVKVCVLSYNSQVLRRSGLALIALGSYIRDQIDPPEHSVWLN